MVVTLAVTARSDSSSNTELAASFDRDAASGQVLTSLSSAAKQHDLAGFLALWDDSAPAQHQARMLFDNLTSLDVGLDLEVLLAFDLPTSEQGEYGSRAWGAQVAADWRLVGIDRRVSGTTLDISFGLDGDTTRIVAMATSDADREPIWLTGPLSVVRGPHTLAAAADPGDAAELSGLLRTARIDVRRTAGSAGRTSVAYLPADLDDYEALLDRGPDQFDQIAAVALPGMIAVNPDAYDAMSEAGRRIVVTHEVTHLALGTSPALPAWLREGFADYVATRFAGVDLGVLTASAVRFVRVHGVPRALPADSEFGSAQQNLEARYELSMLAVRALVDAVGEQPAVQLYRNVGSGRATLLRALHALGTDIGALTRHWRADVEEWADAA